MKDKRRVRGDHVVGYGRPPKEHQFKKNTSGNPNGRPRKKRLDEATNTPFALDAMLDKIMTVKVNGKLTRMTTEEAFLERVKLELLTGNPNSRISMHFLNFARERYRRQVTQQLREQPPRRLEIVFFDPHSDEPAPPPVSRWDEATGRWIPC